MPGAEQGEVLCPEGCGCRLGTFDADRRECGCTGTCATGPRTTAELEAQLTEDIQALLDHGVTRYDTGGLDKNPVVLAAPSAELAADLGAEPAAASPLLRDIAVVLTWADGTPATLPGPRQAIRSAWKALGLGAFENASDVRAALARELYTAMPGTPAGDELTRRAEMIAALEAELRLANAEISRLEGRQAFVVPAAWEDLDDEGIAKVYPDAGDGDELIAASGAWRKIRRGGIWEDA